MFLCGGTSVIVIYRIEFSIFVNFGNEIDNGSVKHDKDVATQPLIARIPSDAPQSTSYMKFYKL